MACTSRPECTAVGELAYTFVKVLCATAAICSTLVCKRSSNTCSKRCCARRWVHSRTVTVRQRVFFPHLPEHMKHKLAVSVRDRTCVKATCFFNATASVSAALLLTWKNVSNSRCSDARRRSESFAFVCALPEILRRGQYNVAHTQWTPERREQLWKAHACVAWLCQIPSPSGASHKVHHEAV